MSTSKHLKWNPSRVYYGWWIVAACFISTVYTGGIIVFGFTAFFDPLIKEFGWSYAQVSLAASLRGAETGLIAPLLGYMVDRWGARWLMFLGASIVGIGILLLSRISSLGMFYAAFLLIAIGLSCSSPAIIFPATSTWFRKRLGLATGILAVGFGLGSLLIPVVTGIIDALSWRNALLVLGIGTLVICLPLALVVKRKNEPSSGVIEEEMTHPESHTRSKSLRIKEPEVEIGQKQALKSRTFWHITVAFALQYVVISAEMAHIMPYLEDVGIARSTASMAAAAVPLISLISRFGSGWASDRFSGNSVAMGSFALMVIGSLLFYNVSRDVMWLLAFAIVIFALGWGGGFTTRAILLKQYFAGGRFGTLFGFLLGVGSIGAMLGPILAGWIFDTWKSYSFAWILFAILDLMALVLIATLPKKKYVVR